MPADLRNATVAIEDEHFYKHGGVDYGAIVRAGIKNLESGKNLQGGSTITQQLVRALYIDDPQRNIERKIREAKLASELEQERSKKWILQSYLNDVPYGTVGGRTAIGVEAAAETFFDKHARDLTLGRGGDCSPACRRRRRSTTRSRTRAPRSRAATRCCGRWPTTATSRRPQATEAQQASARRQAGHALHAPPRALLLRLRPGAADRALRRRRLPPRRAQGLHDDQPEDAGRRARRDQPVLRRPRRPGLGDRLDRSARTARSRRWRRAAPTRTAPSTSPPRPTASPARRSRRWC